MVFLVLLVFPILLVVLVGQFKIGFVGKQQAEPQQIPIYEN